MKNNRAIQTDVCCEGGRNTMKLVLGNGKIRQMLRISTDLPSESEESKREPRWKQLIVENHPRMSRGNNRGKQNDHIKI